IQIEIRWAAGDEAKLQHFAKELVSLKPDVILANTTPAARRLANGCAGDAASAFANSGHARRLRLGSYGRVEGKTLMDQSSLRRDNRDSHPS
ncbi:MAG: hypothetical protein ACJ8D9_28900, partial [Xanthobacteraceae bacterium]